MTRRLFASRPWLAAALATAPALVVAPLAAGCSSSSSSSTPDSAVADAHEKPSHDAGADRATADATKPDTGMVKRDAGHDATKEHDAGHPDTGKGEDAAKDTGRVEDAPKDTGKRDSETEHDAARDVVVDANQSDAPVPFFDAGPGCAVGPMGEAIDLKCAGLYSDWDSKTIAPGVIAYKPGLQLWSDGAIKNRWISLPPGQTIDTSDMDEWNFPVGTHLFKEFNLPTSTSDGGLRRIETRLIWKVADGSPATNGQSVWYLTTYRWTEDGETDATELTAGQLDANGLGYEVPTQADCTTCHMGREDFVMGFEAVSLAQASSFYGSPDAGTPALPLIIGDGLLSAPPSISSLTIPGDPAAATALGWLHVNCGIACHNLNPMAAAAGETFLARLDVSTLGSVQDTWAYVSAWDQASNFPIPDASSPNIIQPCSPGTSAAYYYADHRDGVDGYTGLQMPIIDTHVVDEAGVEEFAAWINDGCDAGTDAH